MYSDLILKLAKQLFPTGRAFKMPANSVFEKLEKGLAQSESRAYADGLSVLDSILPDNANFSQDDATQWETRLGLIVNSGATLSDRKLAIRRKMNHPGSIKARQNYLYLEGQLQAAGFDVYVHENRFSDGMGGYYTKTPEDIIGLYDAGVAEHSDDIDHGDVDHGAVYDHLVVNNINEDKDSVFDIGDNYRSTFYIGGPYLGEYAEIIAERKDEFRQLILKIKPAQTVGILFIAYV